MQYLTENGYDPDQVMIGAIEWHSGNVVNGLVTARGEQLIHRGEDQTEIDAAMVPTCLFDMQEAGQTHHWREAIQDFVSSHEFDWGYPPFRQFGSIGVTTGGGEAFHYHGVKKANYNALALVDKLEGGIRLSCKSTGKKILDGQGTVNCLAVSQPGGVYRVLIWSYISPRRYVDRRNPGDNRVGYDELYSYTSLS